jgi:hypothetical protein
MKQRGARRGTRDLPLAPRPRPPDPRAVTGAAAGIAVGGGRGAAGSSAACCTVKRVLPATSAPASFITEGGASSRVLPRVARLLGRLWPRFFSRAGEAATAMTSASPLSPVSWRRSPASSAASSSAAAASASHCARTSAAVASCSALRAATRAPAIPFRRGTLPGPKSQTALCTPPLSWLVLTQKGVEL